MRRDEAGFTLIELLVAMTLTLIVSGAIVALLSTGGEAFRREPELADRQQNARLAMDSVARDVFNAGAALPTFAQVFTQTETTGCNAGVNGCGAAGVLGTTGAAARGGGDPSENTDVLEILTTDPRCPTLTVCSTTVLGGAAGLFVTRERRSATCQPLPGLVLLTDNTSVAVQPAVASTSTTACPSGGSSTNNDRMMLGNPLAPWTTALPAPASAPPPSTPVVFAYRARLVRYRVAPTGDPQDDSPGLWRSESGRYATDGTAPVEPGESGFPGANSPWELVARGIEDLQLEYMAGDGVWTNLPATVTTNDYNSLTRQVRITLSARASAANLQGQTTASGGPNAVRGQLTTTVTPRAAFNELQMGSQIR
ncbi:MAG: prepilin-type N-terminal cleavage/methylation domain-containing protein [Vicinamibacteria bacterium]